LSDDQVAERVKAEEIDILVDLNGFTQHARTGIFCRRPAPVQVNYLGFPATMGSPFMDYIVADRVLIPPSHQHGYSEKVAYLPGSYLPHDEAARRASERAFARAELGLPERGFVFCCFNAAYKFNPDLFRSWMRILAAVEGSVLWLSQANATALGNLRKQAAAAGIDPARLVFAQRLPSSADHLARLRAADLFLDSWPYNAHTTAGDALWMGLPVLTRIGETFAGRVAASLLNAIGMPDLITESPEQFETLAIELATKPPRLAAIKDRLVRNRSSAALFDTSLYTRQLETLYAQMYQRLQGGMAPDHIYADA
jgi:predicted O-linked N-acetylglucosamine transferase (SPINDLY family)